MSLSFSNGNGVHTFSIHCSCCNVDRTCCKKLKFPLFVEVKGKCVSRVVTGTV